MENGKDRKTVYEKIYAFEQQIRSELGNVDCTNLAKNIGRISHYQQGNIKHLSDWERELYDFILIKKHNLRSLHRWFLLKDVPVDIRKKLERKEISFRTAQILKTQRKKQKFAPIFENVNIEIRKAIKELLI